MSRLITVSLDKRGVSCVARMLEDEAPRTSAGVWDARARICGWAPSAARR